MLTREYIGGLLAHNLGTWFFAYAGRIPDDPLAEFWALVALHEPSPDVEKVLRISYKADGLDLSKVPLACQCLKCTEKAPEDAACLFADISDAVRGLANLDTHLVAEFWDLPYTLYALANLQKQVQIRAELKRMYDADGTASNTASTKAEKIAKASIHQLNRNKRG